MNHSLIARLRMLKISDFFSIFKLILAIFLVPIYKVKEKDLWLITEGENEARDNGYWLFKYIRINKQYINAIYVINKDSADFNKVDKLGRTCEYGSIMHWVYYLIAKYNISTQKGGKPNAAICYVLEVYNILNNTRVFLQHGITYNNAEWLYYNNTKMRLFVCGARPEYEYVKSNFGYPEDYVKYLGFCRFDNLINTKKTNKKTRILVMPTWREWLVSKTEMTLEINYDGVFENTEYFKKWSELLNCNQLETILEENDIELYFYPHRNMQPYLEKFKTKSEKIFFASWKEYDIQELLINSDLMITDYSSVAFDYAYMEKPIIFYQFDYDMFRKGQYKEGYFDFSKQDFGEVCSKLEEVVNVSKDVIERNFKLKENEKNYVESFFELRDNKNCERIFECINNIQKGE